MRQLSKRVKVVILAAATACAATTVTVAVADGSVPARAPYAQAGARVEADGTLSQAKGIKAVTNPQPGHYCITFTDDRIDPQKALPTATLGASLSASNNSGAGTTFDYNIIIRTVPSSDCNNDKSAINVLIGNYTQHKNLPFYFTIA